LLADRNGGRVVESRFGLSGDAIAVAHAAWRPCSRVPSETVRKAPLRGQGPAKRKAQGPKRNEEKGPDGNRDQGPETWFGRGVSLVGGAISVNGLQAGSALFRRSLDGIFICQLTGDGNESPLLSRALFFRWRSLLCAKTLTK